MIGSHPLLQVHRVIKELRLALVLSHHDGNIPLTDHLTLGYYFLSQEAIWATRPKTFNISPIEFFSPNTTSKVGMVETAVVISHLSRSLGSERHRECFREFGRDLNPSPGHCRTV